MSGEVDYDDDNKLGKFVLNICFLVGLITFAVVLGTVTNDLESAVQDLTSGTGPVVEKNHTLMLNINSNTGALLE